LLRNHLRRQRLIEMKRTLRLTVAICLAAIVNGTGATLYVAERGHGDVLAIDTVSGSGRIVASGLGEMIGLAVDRQGRLFVSRFRWGDVNTVAQVDPGTGAWWDIASVPGAFGIFADPDSETLYVGSYQSGGYVHRVTEVSPDLWTVISDLIFPDFPTYGIVSHAFRDQDLLYLTCQDSAPPPGPGLWVKDLRTDILSYVVELPAWPTIIAKEPGGHLIVGSEGYNGDFDVYRVDASLAQVVEVYSGFTGGPCGVAMHPTDGSLYVAEQCPGRIIRLDLATGQRTVVTKTEHYIWQIAFALEPVADLKLEVTALSAITLALSWNGGPGIRLEKATTLDHADWQELSGSVGVSQIVVPTDGAAAFFRVVKP
jgi:DNA-binding beta-propeller fold protein YncE